MNRDVIKAVRDNIATMPESAFKMEVVAMPTDPSFKYFEPWSHTLSEIVDLKEGDNPCGTAMCIAGRTTAMFAPGTIVREACNKAQELMGLDFNQANHLFLGEVDPESIAGIKKEHAVACLDHLLETGEISWAKAGAHPGYDNEIFWSGDSEGLVEFDSETGEYIG